MPRIEIDMGKLALNKQQKKESLLNTAFDLFLTQGLQKTSISDIVEKAGVAKGTFYLYFKDKYDIHNKIIAHKSSQLFVKILEHLRTDHPEITTLEDIIIFFVDHILDHLNENQNLLILISKNLGWGVFRDAMTNPLMEDDIDFRELYQHAMAKSKVQIDNPDLMLYLIIEFVGSTCYSAILYQEPVSIEELKPHIFSVVRHIINDHILNS